MNSDESLLNFSNTALIWLSLVSLWFRLLICGDYTVIGETIGAIMVLLGDIKGAFIASFGD